jgi:hypothetical protein
MRCAPVCWIGHSNYIASPTEHLDLSSDVGTLDLEQCSHLTGAHRSRIVQLEENRHCRALEWHARRCLHAVVSAHLAQRCVNRLSNLSSSATSNASGRLGRRSDRVMKTAAIYFLT